MSAKTSAEVVIDGKVYTLSGYEGEEYLQKVASYINVYTFPSITTSALVFADITYPPVLDHPLCCHTFYYNIPQ